MSQRGDYGVDAPVVVGNLTGIGAIALILSRLLPLSPALGRALLWAGGSLLLAAISMVISSRIGKLRARDALLDAVKFLPGDKVLDVGCGRGLLLIGAAKRVLQGKVVGVDTWSNMDQFGNSPEVTLGNARVEGVLERVRVQHGDMRQLEFENESFDVVLSSLAIHNVASHEDRVEAVREIARVLKPGGRVGIIDIANTKSYARVLRRRNVEIISGPKLSPWIFPPARVIVGVKSSETPE